MKLRVIAKTAKGEKMNLKLLKESKIILYGEEFEVPDVRGKEILATKNANGAIVEKVKNKKESEELTNDESNKENE